MDWYYANEGKQVGPVSDEEFQALVEVKMITSETLVWNETLPKWLPYAEVKSGTSPTEAAKEPSSSLHFKPSRPMGPKCSECGKTFAQNDMVRISGAWVCAGCKPIVVQRLKEGVKLSHEMEYGGFWIRFAAKFLDGIILMIVQFSVGILQGLLFGLGDDPGGTFVAFTYLFNITIGVLYTTFFLGKYGATPGKMACKLQVVMSDGGEISYGRACGRHFAEILSSLIFAIGYIMAAFDDEKRTLHDRICDTRVIKK